MIHYPNTQINEKYSYNFYFLSNMSYYYTYKLLNNIKEQIILYTMLERYRARIEHSQTFSVDQFDVSMIRNVPSDKKVVKELVKSAKKQLMKDFIAMTKINKYHHNVYMDFYNYVSNTIQCIKKQTGINSKTNNHIKIGHYLINFKVIKDVCNFHGSCSKITDLD
jgi:hypothetical protein